MTDAASSTSSPGRSRWLGPPGVLFYIATTVAVAVALDASSRHSLGMLAIAVVLWLAIALMWLVRFISHSRFRMSAAQWIRWLVIPAVMGMVFVAALSDSLFDTRFALSRSALDRMAAEVMAGGPTERGVVGLYNVGEVERTANGVRFVLTDVGLFRSGLAYASTGEPMMAEDNYSPLWCCGSFEPLVDGWWIWYEEWD